MPKEKETIYLGEFLVENDQDKKILKRYMENILDGDTYHKPTGLKQKTKSTTTKNINQFNKTTNPVALNQENMIRQQLKITKFNSQKP